MGEWSTEGSCTAMAGRVVLVVALLIIDTLLQKSNLDLGALEIGRTGAYKSFYPDPIPTSTPYLASTMKATQKQSSSNGIGLTTKSAWKYLPNPVFNIFPSSSSALNIIPSFASGKSEFN